MDKQPVTGNWLGTGQKFIQSIVADKRFNHLR
jgi:hypothetical protein